MVKMLKEITSILSKISKNENLTVEETEKAFDICIAKDKESYFFTALTMGLMAKGITSDELFGFCKSREKLLPKIDIKINTSKITDNSGTGGDKLKTFNISTTAAFILCAADIPIAKQAFFAVTGVVGSGDLFREFDIDVIKTSNTETIKKSIENIGFVPYVADFLPQPDKIPGILNFVKKRNEVNLHYITPYHLAANIVTPIKIERRIYGIFDSKYSKILVEVLKKLNYKRALIVHGIGGLDEISNIGDTEIVELDKNKIKNYTITPEDFGVKKATYEDIKTISVEQNVIDFLRILFNKEKGPKRDIVLMNAAASLYIMDKVKDFKEGVDLANKIVEEGKAANKLKELVNLLGNTKKLKEWKIKAKIES